MTGEKKGQGNKEEIKKKMKDIKQNEKWNRNELKGWMGKEDRMEKRGQQDKHGQVQIRWRGEREREREDNSRNNWEMKNKSQREKQLKIKLNN